MKKIVIILFLLQFAKLARAQDVHFSQFYSSPLTINPANTGLFNGFYRVGANYKRQWASIPVPYQTFSAWGDMSFKRSDRNSFGKSALGLCVVQDQAGDGRLSATKINLSAAVHIPLDYDHTQYISAGLQASYVQRRIDFNQLYWGNQWDGTQFNTQLNNKEPYRQSSFGYFDAALGVDYLASFRDVLTVHGGFSIQHLVQPKETFYNNDNHIGIKPALNAGGRYIINERNQLWTEVFFEEQKKANEFLISGLWGYNAAEDYNYFKSLIWFGLSMRWKDAIVPVLGYERNRMRILLNYDINFSSLRVATQARGGIEVSLIYMGENNTPPYRQPRIVPCPVF